MPCPDENAVLDFFDDQLPAEEAADVERHMARCTDCRRLKLQQVAVEELKQILREQLFVAAPPKGALLIDNYSGRGQLGRWLRVIAVRTAGKLLDQGKKEVPLSDSVLSGLSPPVEDPELEFLKRTYRKEFSQAFEQAACELSVRQRNLLGHHYLDRLSIDEIGSIYAVHRATAARWLVKARETLLAGTRKDLMRRIQVDRAEYESIMRLIESQLPMAFQGTTSDDNPFQK